MFATNQAKKPVLEVRNNTKIIDPFTIWLIRIACLLIIIVFSGLLLGVPLAISICQSLLSDILINAKGVLRNLIETSLV